MYENILFLNTNNGEEVLKKKFYFICSLLIIIYLGFLSRVFNIAYKSQEFYWEEYRKISEVFVKGGSAPRGRILDINGNIIVDNVGINTIKYRKIQGITVLEEINIAKELSKLTNYEYNYDQGKLKEFLMIYKADLVNELVTEEEYRLYSERKISKQELEEIKLNRITDELIDTLSLEEKYSSYFYFLMNEGYDYDNKILLSNVDDNLYASIIESNLKGVFGEIDWMRKYNYGDTLKSVLGSISNSLPEEKKYLLNSDYSYSDKVGISGLEEYYEEYLRGEKAIYKVNETLELVSEAKRGNDLVLEIDIDLQVKIENIIKDQIKKAKLKPNTEYYRESYALLGDPNTGAVKVMAGIRLLDNGEFQDVSINITRNAYTVGSSVKAASMAVAYQNKAIDIGTTMVDSCVKLANIPAKCSFRRLGKLDDLRALAMSSNYYQFVAALKVAGYDYKYNMDAPVKAADFQKYRSVFEEFGLGVKTGIDLTGETAGLKGDKIAPDLLMNLAIGQYDLYTTTSLLQYINTVANSGVRLKLNLMHNILGEEGIILEGKKEVLNKVELDQKYFKRIQEGLRQVLQNGTGYGYINNNISAAGKTGTSESYIDVNYDGKMDAYVISNTFIMYAPIDEPKYSLVVISPNVANLNGKNDYISPVNRLIARNINDLLFSSP